MTGQSALPQHFALSMHAPAAGHAFWLPEVHVHVPPTPGPTPRHDEPVTPAQSLSVQHAAESMHELFAVQTFLPEPHLHMSPGPEHA